MRVFDTEVAPVLAAQCLSCHQGDKAEAGLNLRVRDAAMRGGDSGRAIIPNHPDASLLWERVEADEMPPEHALSAEDKAILRRWLEEGARWGQDPIEPFTYSSSRRAGYDWWSLQPLEPKQVPQVGDDDWSENEIDRFVLARLKEQHLKPSRRADPRTLVRRLYVDLLGLPAPASVITKFEDDPSRRAWHALVDELLASPHYGERWARHWMDIARFGESNGFEYNEPRDHAWPYRDWLVQALNEDLPYDEFVRMQLAGDLLRPDAVEGLAAVGFLVAGTHNSIVGVNPAMKLSARQDELEELAGTVGQTFLGLTVNCARCHDHKFDPVSQQEYYQFIALLDGVRHGVRTLQVSASDEDASSRERAQRRTEVYGVAERKLMDSLSLRKAFPSETANELRSREAIDANSKGLAYEVSFLIAPTVWANPAQATERNDGVIVRIVRDDGSILASHVAKPGRWDNTDPGVQFKLQVFRYVGDGRGDVQVQLAPTPLNSGRFGGAIDELRIVEANTERVVMHESFSDLRQHQPAGKQAGTGRLVYFGATSNRWDSRGINSIHAVERDAGDHALQLFGGIGGAQQLNAETAEEQSLRSKLMQLEREASMQQQRKIYSVNRAANPGAMLFYKRGDVTAPGEAVAPGGLVATNFGRPNLTLANVATDAQRRRALADWITHAENGLFHRVFVNRVWHYHFGSGLVTTPNDFGFNGGQPSHPHLLDWLSRWFRDNGYSIKKLHRLMVLSATYQQASTSRPKADKLDRNNRWLWRQNSRRVEAEVLRDSMLVISGQFDSQLYGPGFRDVNVVRVPPAFYYSPVEDSPEAFNRRTIYRWHVRGQRSALLDTFDCPDPSTNTPNRLVTTTPSQALSLWNDRFVMQMSQALTERIRREASDRVQSQVRHAWRLVLGRGPDEVELDQSMQLVRDHDLTLLCRVLFNTNEFILID